MTRREHLMVTTAEEAMEVGHRITKAMRFGMTEVQPGQTLTNAERIVDEFHDLFAMLVMMMAEGVLPIVDLIPGDDRLTAKWDKVDRFLATVSTAQGTLLDTDAIRDALQPFKLCADELDGRDDVPAAPDGEWAKFRLLTDDYRRVRTVYEGLPA